MNSEILDTYLTDNNGFYTIRDVRALGVSKGHAIQYVNKANLQKLSHGVYCSEDAWPDHLYTLQIRNKNIVFSHETALFLHGLSDRESFHPVVTVRRGYNASHLKKENVKVHTVIADWFDIGITTVETTAGNMIRVYDKERCICDIIRNKKHMDIQVFTISMNAYFRDRDKDIYKLSKYASIFGIEDRVRQYTEVLL
ncbi:MAG: abortive phage infection protein [Anaerolineaceae bacterium]|nr:abortive phage infection protein [Anaerolineaceae bacterium]